MTRRRALLAVRSHQLRQEQAAALKAREAETPPATPDEPEVDALAAEFEELFGRKPGNMKPETMAARIAAEKDDADNDDAE